MSQFRIIVLELLLFYQNLERFDGVFSLLYRACCQVTQLFYQPLHLYKFIKFTPSNIKTLKTLRHVSVLGPSSGSYIFLAKFTLLKVILISLFQLVLWHNAVLCCVAKSALLWMCVLCFVAWYACLFTPTVSKTEFYRQILVKPFNVTFHENPSTGSQVIPHVVSHGRTDMTKQTVAFFELCGRA